MDRFRHKSKTDQSAKNVSKEKCGMIPDRIIKEHLKIKEFLRIVKMNSSHKKLPIKDIYDNCSDKNPNLNDSSVLESNSVEEPPSAINIEFTIPIGTNETINEKCVNDFDQSHTSENITDSENGDLSQESSDLNLKIPVIYIEDQPDENASRTGENSTESEGTISQNDDNQTQVENIPLHDTDDGTDTLNDQKVESDDGLLRKISVTSAREKTTPQHRERKLSLDQIMLNRQESFSQSELDLHSIGKSPLERKSSFFRKKLDSFFKNTSEVFKKQSMNNKSQLQRKGSISMSLQSLNEHKDDYDNENNESISPIRNNPTLQNSQSLRSISTVSCSNTSLQGEQKAEATDNYQDSLADSPPTLSSSQPIEHVTMSQISLDEAGIQESLLNSRAISMSSGLDTAEGKRRKKRSRANRVTWLASEGLTNYLRRMYPDENIYKDIHESHSYQDLSSIPENQLYGSKADSKGRRLSYQKAVSGEDPVSLQRCQEFYSKKKGGTSENYETNFELANQLAEFTRSGVPSLKGFCIANVPDEAFAYLLWAERAQNLEEFYDWKKITPNEEARQAVIRELVTTEADYIRHLISIVEVFIAAAHALQDSGKLLDVDTERLFSNIPDVLNASLCFWEMTIYPMLADALEKGTPFNTELMAPGFCRFRELFQPYEKYVNEQTKALDYLRSLSGNTDFMAYLAWCHGHKSCNRLQISDIMVKPMQRLTKYSLILRRIITHTDTEPERTNLLAMESFAKNYVLDLNRSIRQREELEKLDALANSIDVYEIDFKDEDLDRYFRMYSQLNLKAPMVNCLPTHSRTLIHQGDLRFRDNVKEIEVRAFLLTDMLLICKKLSKGGTHPFKLIRPKYMVEKMMHFPKYQSRVNTRDIVGLIFVVMDDVGTAFQSFALTEPAKDANPHATLKLWEQKLREAKLTYDLGVWFAKNPSRDLSEVEMDSSSDYAVSAVSGPRPVSIRPSSDDINIEREARERVAAMLHRSMGASTEYDFSQASLTTDSFDGEASGTSGGRTPGLHNLRHPMHRNSTGGSSRNSRLSSFQQSTSAASHDEPQAGPSKNLYKAGTSVEHLIPAQNPDDGVTSITVNVVSESESETVVPSEPVPPQPTLQQSPKSPSPSKSPSKHVSRSSSSHKNTLRVQPQIGVMALVHSLPDLTIDPSPPRPSQSPSPQSASEKLYQSHQELLQRNRLSAAQHQYLTPDHRGTSYPPPSPTRASLKRGLAFSYSFKNPPLSKMGHVNSQSQLQAEAGPSTSQKGDKAAATQQPMPSTSTDKGDKKSKFVSSRNKGGRSLSPSRKEDKGAD